MNIQMKAVEQCFYVVFVFSFNQMEILHNLANFYWSPAVLLGVQWLRLNIEEIKTWCKELLSDLY